MNRGAWGRDASSSPAKPTVATCLNLEKFIRPTLSKSLTITLLSSRDKCSEVLAAGSAYSYSSTKETAGLQEIVRFFPSNGVQTRVYELKGMLGLGKDDIIGSP